MEDGLPDVQPMKASSLRWQTQQRMDAITEQK
jgi:hypothetical protein